VTVKQAYLAELAAKGYQSDPAQLRAVDALQRWHLRRGFAVAVVAIVVLAN